MAYTFRQRVKQLRRDFPVNCRVRVYLRPFGSIIRDGQRWMGYAQPLDDGSVSIFLEDHPDPCVTKYNLWHEWAHVRYGHPVRDNAPHPLDWWKEHGRIVNYYVDTLGNK